MWAFKQLWDKGLVYEGFRVVPYSWAAQTPLSQSETRLDNSYRAAPGPGADRRLPARRRRRDTRLLAWTTTPWTLPSNMGLAVKPDADYAVHGEGRRARHPRRGLARALRAGARRLRHGRHASRAPSWSAAPTQPLFPFFADRKAEGAFRVVAGDFIELGEGTGVVHMAPAFGEDDLERRPEGRPAGGRSGRPRRQLHRLSAALRRARTCSSPTRTSSATSRRPGVVVRHETYDHNYPHCWRTDQPLIYKAMPSWYVEVTAFRDRMVELNQGITWMPAHVRDGIFGNWLANARDWNVGRNRYWGAPIPVWKSDDPAYPRTDVLRLARRDRARFRRAAEGSAPPLRRRADAAEPGRPDRQVDHAPGRGRARLLVRVRLDAVLPGALSVREQGVVRRATSPAISSSNTSARRAAGSTR